MGDNIDGFIRSTDTLFDQLKLSKIKSMELPPVSAKKVFRILIMWFGLSPTIGHIFRCCNKLLNVDVETAYELFRETS